MKNCPICQIQLNHVLLEENLPAFKCPDCDGIWIFPEEIFTDTCPKEDCRTWMVVDTVEDNRTWMIADTAGFRFTISASVGTNKTPWDWTAAPFTVAGQ